MDIVLFAGYSTRSVWFDIRKKLVEMVQKHKMMEYWKVKGVTVDGVEIIHYTMGEANAKAMVIAWDKSVNIVRTSYDRCSKEEYMEKTQQHN